MKHISFLVFMTLSMFACKDDGANSTQEADEQVLNGLRNEIVMLSNATPCTDASLWRAVALGTKACGGPVEYLPYSIAIDTEAFLRKVALYNKAQDAYNKKWRVISNCLLVGPPSDIICVDGKPQMTF